LSCSLKSTRPLLVCFNVKRIRSIDHTIDRSICCRLFARPVLSQKTHRSLSIYHSVHFATIQLSSWISPTMGKQCKSKRSTKKVRGWKANSKDGKFLMKLFKTGKLRPGDPPSHIKELYKQFRKYKPDSFASGLRRLKNKLAINARPAPDAGTRKLIRRSIACLLARSCYLQV